MDLPLIISVDDHVVEPPDLWSKRLPTKYAGTGPRVVRERGRLTGYAPAALWLRDESGAWGDVWYYEDIVRPLGLPDAAAGSDTLAIRAVTFDEILPGCWDRAARLEDMSANHVDVSLCFPNTLPRFCGQTFSEAQDKDLGLLCIRAYNDWMIDEWCASEAQGRLVPLTIVPLWDPDLAVAEVLRSAEKGSYAVSFSENPQHLGFEGFYSGSWDPFFATCAETRTTVCMHIGSSSRMAAVTPGAPLIVKSTLTFENSMTSLLDLIFSGTLARFPELVIMYSEGQVGWMPYVFERMDKLWNQRTSNSFGSDLADLPTSYLGDRVYGCIFDDETGLLDRDRVGMQRITFEVDFPHADSTYPKTLETAAAICDQAGLDDAERYELLRGDAIRALGLDRFGVTS